MSDSIPKDHPPPTPQIDKDQIREALELLVSPEEVFEIRIIGDGPAKFRAFDGHELDEATQWVVNNERDARGVYVLMNPLPADFPKNGPAANDKSILRRRAILIDVDRKNKTNDSNATDGEKAALRVVADRIISYLVARGWPCPILIDSGNGWHLIVRVDLPANDDGLAHRFLKVIAQRFNDGDAEIDVKVANPSRITKLPGTVARKGPHSHDRPHRRAELVEVPDEINIVSRELLEALAAELIDELPTVTTHATSGTASANTIERARAYLAKIPPAVSGQHGHDATFNTACKIVRGFDLDDATAFMLLWEWNLTCDPPWTERDIRRKISEARNKGREPLGYLLTPSTAPLELGQSKKIKDESKNVLTLKLKSFADIEPGEPEWLWPGRIPRGCITLLAGAPGQGKSYVTAAIAGIVTTGGNWPDGGSCDVGDVLFVTLEDDPATVTTPRLIAHGADRTRCHLLEGVQVESEKRDPYVIPFTLEHLDELKQVVQRIPNLALIVIDPAGSFIGGSVDSDKDNKVRAVLQPLATWAQELNIAVLVVAHHRKSSTDGAADDKVLGSIGFVGLARSVLHVVPIDENDKNRRALTQGKTNFAQRRPTLEFRIAGDPAIVNWSDEPIDLSADDLLVISRPERSKRRGPEPRKKTEAIETLRGLLSGTRLPVESVYKHFEGSGISRATISRAAEILDVVRERDDESGTWFWSLVKLDHVLEGGDQAPAQLENLTTCEVPVFPEFET